MDSNIEKIIEETINKLEENHLQIQSCNEKLINIYKKQSESFIKLGEKLSPIIEYLKKHKYPFNSELFGCYSLDGPVIGFDGDTIYTWNDGFLVNAYNIHTEQTRTTTLTLFFEKHSYKKAIESLLEVLQIQNKQIEKLQEKIDSKENELSEINKKINDI